MNIKKLCVALAVGIALGGVSAGGSASADRCGSRPDGVVVPSDPSTYNSAGEVVSYLATKGIVNIGAVGLDVKEACGGAPG